MTSRLIIQNLPQVVDQNKLKEIFSKFGQVTDVKIMFKENKSRRFCFVGFVSADSAQKAQQYYNQSYIYMSKVTVEFARSPQEESEIKKNLLSSDNKQWKGDITHLMEIKNQKLKENEKNAEKNEKSNPQTTNNFSDEQKAQFQEFLAMMKNAGRGSTSWNDAFEGEKAVQNQKKSQTQQSSNQQSKIEKLKSLDEFMKGKMIGEKQTKQQELSSQIAQEIKSATEPQIQQYQKIFKKEEPIQTEQKEEIKDVINFDEKRLYIVNIPFTIAEDQVRKVFEQFGKITEFQVPKGNDGKLKGILFVTYSMAEEAARAFAEVDNQIYFGRVLFVKPALQGFTKQSDEQANQEKKPETEEEKSSYKKKQKIEMRKKLNDTTNWNTLFLNPNSILESISKRFNIKKSDILSPDADNMAVKVSQVETQIINETQHWMVENGMNLDFLDQDREKCERSDKIILVKNLSFQTTESQIKQTFEHYGSVLRVLMCPNKALAIVEYEDSAFAQNAFQMLSYQPINHSPLYLEWAPIGMVERVDVNQGNGEAGGDDAQSNLIKVLYIKNLNFTTTEKELEKHFDKANIGDISSVKIVKKDGKSQGYAFIEFKNADSVMNSIQQLQNSILQGHALKLSVSQKTENKDQNKSQLQRRRTDIDAGTVIVIRNLAFEANQSELRELVKNYGEIKALRIPNQMNGQHRGFAFVQFASTEEARNAFSALENTHFYGRQLVIEWAEQSRSLDNQD